MSRKIEIEVERLRRERDELYDIVVGRIMHVYQGSCPDTPDDDDRDPECRVCQILGAMEPHVYSKS